MTVVSVDLANYQRMCIFQNVKLFLLKDELIKLTNHHSSRIIEVRSRRDIYSLYYFQLTKNTIQTSFLTSRVPPAKKMSFISSITNMTHHFRAVKSSTLAQKCIH